MQKHRKNLMISFKTTTKDGCLQTSSALVKKAATELNAAKRLAILKDIAVKVTASAPALYIVEQIDLYALGKGVHGFSAGNRAIAYENIYVN